MKSGRFKLIYACSQFNHLQADLVDSVSAFMAYVLGSVNEISQTYLANEKRHNYTTPKSFLELIALYSKLLTEKTNDNQQRILRLDNGLIRLAQCAEQVDSLKVILYSIAVFYDCVINARVAGARHEAFESKPNGFIENLIVLKFNSMCWQNKR